MKINFKLKTAKTCSIEFKYDPQLVRIVKSVPSRKWNSNNRCWDIPLASVSDARKLFESENHEVILAPDLRIAVEKVTEKQKAILKQVEISDLEYSVRAMQFKNTPLEHQYEAMERALKSNSLLLADDMGLGKTFVSINVACIRKTKDKIKKTLIICGINSVKYNWQEEIKMHSTEQGTVFEGKNMSERLEQVQAWVSNEDENFFGIINIESLQKEEILKALETGVKKNIISMIIIDEVHKCKNPTSIRGKAIHKLNSTYKLALTGTPIMNRAEELYNILKWLGAEVRTFGQFKTFYCNFGGFMNNEVVGYKNLDVLRNTLNKCMLRRRKEDVLTLPDKLYKTEYLQMSKKSMKLYMEVRQELIRKIDEIVLDSNPLSKLLRLRQITSGLLSDDSVKLDRLLEILEEAKETNKKVIIFSQWKAVIDAVNTHLSNNDIKPLTIDGTVDSKERQAIVNNFQNVKGFKVITGTIGAMGTGLTLNTAEIVVFLDKAWTPADNRQAEDRAYRIGTKHNVNIISLVCKNTIDEYIENMLTEKQDLFNEIVEGKSTRKQSKEQLIRILLGADK